MNQEVMKCLECRKQLHRGEYVISAKGNCCWKCHLKTHKKTEIRAGMLLFDAQRECLYRVGPKTIMEGWVDEPTHWVNHNPGYENGWKRFDKDIQAYIDSGRYKIMGGA